MKVIAQVTARMGSERFPGKVMAPLYGRPMIGWIYERMAQVKGLNRIVLATSDKPENEPLIEYTMRRWKFVDVVVGPDYDLMSRHRKVFEFYNYDWVVDISGDSPIYTPEVIERFIAAIPGAEKEGAHTISFVQPYNAVYGNPLGNLHGKRWMQHYCDLQDSDEIPHLEQYWVESKGPEGPTTMVDCRDLVSPPKTPIKISVDYALELAILEMVCRWLGHFPKTLAEVYDAYKKIRAVKVAR